MKINVVLTMWWSRLQNRSTEIFHSKYKLIKNSGWQMMMMMPTLVKTVTTNSETNKVRENVVASGISSYHSLLYEQQWSLNRLCVHCEFEQFHSWFYAFCIDLCTNIPCMIVVHRKPTKLQEFKALQLKEDKSASWGGNHPQPLCVAGTRWQLRFFTKKHWNTNLSVHNF